MKKPKNPKNFQKNIIARLAGINYLFICKYLFFRIKYDALM